MAKLKYFMRHFSMCYLKDVKLVLAWISLNCFAHERLPCWVRTRAINKLLQHLLLFAFCILHHTLWRSFASSYIWHLFCVTFGIVFFFFFLLSHSVWVIQTQYWLEQPVWLGEAVSALTDQHLLWYSVYTTPYFVQVSLLRAHIFTVRLYVWYTFWLRFFFFSINYLLLRNKCPSLYSSFHG